MKGERPQMINRQLMVIVLTFAILIWVPSAEAQRYCDSPVPHFPNRSEVSLFVSGFASSTGNLTMSSVSHLNWHEMTNQFLKAPSFPALVAGFRVVDARVSHEGAAERKIRVQFVTAPYFEVLGVRAQMGRTFNGDEDRPEDNNAIAVISDQLWMSMFHFDPEVVGRTMKVNGRRVTIIGVAPPGFHGVLQPSEETFWLPGASMPGANNRGSEGYAHFVVTLGDGITWQEARSHFARLTAALVKAFPDVNQKFNTVSFYDFGPLTCPSQ
jgi:hypothetical protein